MGLPALIAQKSGHCGDINYDNRLEMDGKEKPKVKADFRPGQKSMELGKTVKQSWPKGVGRRHCLLVLIKP